MALANAVATSDSGLGGLDAASSMRTTKRSFDSLYAAPASRSSESVAGAGGPECVCARA